MSYFSTAWFIFGGDGLPRRLYMIRAYGALVVSSR
jgi:hypothetical protein